MQNKNDLLNLIESVKNHSKLYANFTQNDEDDIKEWTTVAQECGMSVAEAQDQWNMLMNEYVEYLKNNRSFSLAQHMDFLQPHFFAINEKESIDELELLKAIGTKNCKETNFASEEHSNSLETGLNICFEVQKQIKTENTQNPSPSNNTEFGTDSISGAVPQGNSITSMSSLELIFLGYAKQLQRMPLALQLSAKRKIADVMDEAELQMMSL